LESVDSLKLLLENGLGRLDETLDGIDEEDLDWKIHPESNTIRNIIKHIIQEWYERDTRTLNGDIITYVEPPEGLIKPDLTLAELHELLENGKQHLWSHLENVNESDLETEIDWFLGKKTTAEYIVHGFGEILHHEGQIAAIKASKLRIEIKQNTDLSVSLLESLSLVFDMYETAIGQIPDPQWNKGEIDYLVPAKQILHGVEVWDSYTSDTPQGYLCDQRFKFTSEIGKISIEELPSKQEVLEYHYDVRMKTENWLNKLSFTDLMEPEEIFPWTGSTLLGRIVYMFGHHRQHLGELNSELRRRGLPRIKWTVIPRRLDSE
jgi:hypothetical protein